VRLTYRFTATAVAFGTRPPQFSTPACTTVHCRVNMASADQWPASLKAFVNATFAACTEANRAKVEAELKQAIFQAYTAGTLDQVDWANYKLEACVALLLL
jgi:hypothetical protein